MCSSDTMPDMRDVPYYRFHLIFQEGWQLLWAKVLSDSEGGGQFYVEHVCLPGAM